MFRRWTIAGLALLAAFALACEGTGNADPAPTGRPKPGLPASMAALGDSITAGFGSCLTLVVCGRNSFATGSGSSVQSHYRSIREGNPAIKGHVDNFAEPGARAADLAAQAGQAVRAKPAYVTVLIGANDACARDVDGMTSIKKFRQGVDAGLTKLRKGLPKARILVVSIPDLYRLWQLGHDDAKAVRAWNSGVCPALLADPTSTDKADNARRRAVADRVDAYDDQLEAACTAYGKKCRWDGGSAHAVRFSLDLVNHLDYFHPNAKGQDTLAEATYPGKFTW
ncbi:SGNH/GDSL hydrolase family protein [Micromonosporaceae bacterium Da 78-11]